VKRTAAAIALVILALGVLAAVALSGCGGGSGGDVPEGAVATVGDVTVSRAQVDELIAQAETQLKAQGQSFPKQGTAQYDEYVGKIVEYLVGNEIVTQSAPEYKVTVTDAEVDDQITQMEQAYGGKSAFQKMLTQAGMTDALLKATIKSQLLSQKLQTIVTKAASVSETDLKAYWDAHKDQLVKDKKTATFAKAKSTLRATLLNAARQKLWNEWLSERTRKIGVTYADGYDPAMLKASASPSAAAGSGG
jgi:hypothetical protein